MGQSAGAEERTNDMSVPGSRHGMRLVNRRLAAVLVVAASDYGQSFDVTPLFGRRWGGSLKLQQEGLSNSQVRVEDANTFGIAAGYRFEGDNCDKCALIEFRWMTEKANLGFSSTGGRPSITTNRFIGDFVREFPVSETRDIIRPYLSLSLGATWMSTPVESRTRFLFGIGTGFKVFPKPRWGFRVHAEYLPTVMSAEVQRVVCHGGCVVILNGGVMNQFSVSVGPVFRF